MKTNMAVMLAVLGLITLGLFANLSCSTTGADVYLEGVSIGSVTVEGKPVTGLPSQTVNIVLKVNANTNKHKQRRRADYHQIKPLERHHSHRPEWHKLYRRQAGTGRN